MVYYEYNIQTGLRIFTEMSDSSKLHLKSLHASENNRCIYSLTPLVCT